jgi:hypothetical protein
MPIGFSFRLFNFLSDSGVRNSCIKNLFCPSKIARCARGIFPGVKNGQEIGKMSCIAVSDAGVLNLILQYMSHFLLVPKQKTGAIPK